MSSPLPSLVILATYILFVKIGPLYMKGRPAYNLNKIILFYNFLQICCCGHIIKSAAVLTFRSNPRLFCEPVNYSNDPIAIQIAETCWQFYLLKIVDLLDTVSSTTFSISFNFNTTRSTNKRREFALY
ncbi:hypothetical protein C0J52_14566 [Blattella germanica]|nr:hypothetical protein C0J52_14566 [Blattella germanica]